MRGLNRGLSRGVINVDISDGTSSVLIWCDVIPSDAALRMMETFSML